MGEKYQYGGAMRLSAVVKVFLMAKVRQRKLRLRVSYVSTTGLWVQYDNVT